MQSDHQDEMGDNDLEPHLVEEGVSKILDKEKAVVKIQALARGNQSRQNQDLSRNIIGESNML